MKRIATAAVLIPLVLLLIFTNRYPLITVVAGAVAELAAWEYLGLADASGAKTPRVVVMTSIAMLFVAGFYRPDLLAPVLSCLSMLIFVVCVFRSPVARVLADSAFSVFGLLYIGFSLATLPWLSAQENGRSLITLLLFVVWSGDIAAMYIGRAYGRRPLAATLSPNKTWEGTIASIVGSVAITLALILVAAAFNRRGNLMLNYPGPILHWLGLAVVLNIAAQLGDLVESAIKRGAGVKDSGTLLPGHGGVLDRIDALLLAAPLLWYAQIAQQYF